MRVFLPFAQYIQSEDKPIVLGHVFLMSTSDTFAEHHAAPEAGGKIDWPRPEAARQVGGRVGHECTNR